MTLSEPQCDQDEKRPKTEQGGPQVGVRAMLRGPFFSPHQHMQRDDADLVALFRRPVMAIGRRRTQGGGDLGRRHLISQGLRIFDRTL